MTKLKSITVSALVLFAASAAYAQDGTTTTGPTGATGESTDSIMDDTNEAGGVDTMRTETYSTERKMKKQRKGTRDGGSSNTGSGTGTGSDAGTGTQPHSGSSGGSMGGTQ